jgi:hypothetical protein
LLPSTSSAWGRLQHWQEQARTISTQPWPLAAEDVIERLPDDWLEEHRGALRVRPNRRRYLPQAVRIRPDGVEGDPGLDCHYVPAPVRFCLQCGISYGSWQSLDFPKLASLGTEGRSSATTVLSLTAARLQGVSYRVEPQLPPDILGIFVYLPTVAGGSPA